MLRKQIGALFVVGTTLLALAGCSTEVKRMDVNSVKDISGYWNDTDSRLVAEEMIRDSLSRGWIDQFKDKHQKTPSIIVGNIRNLSYEHINTNTFIDDLERAFINSGRINVVASRSERKDIRAERLDMDLNASDESRKEMGRETGADFMLIGKINSIIDATSSEQVRFYQIDLSLVSMADNREVWIGQKKLKKDVKDATFR